MKVVRVDEHSTSVDLDLSDAEFVLLSAREEFSLVAGKAKGIYRVRATSFVGEFHSDLIHISIRPKVGPLNLLKMILLGDDEAVPEATEALGRPDLASDYFWDLLGKLMSQELERLLAGGLESVYQEFEENSVFVRGQICFPDDLRLNVPVRKGTFVRTSHLSFSTEANQLLKWAVLALANHGSEATRGRLNAIAYRMNEVEDILCPVELKLPNQGSRYRLPIYLANLVVRASAFDQASYGIRSPGLFVDMNKVFEGFVRNQLRAPLSVYGWKIPHKKKSAAIFGENIRVEPDIVFQAGLLPVAIGDRKYKLDWNFETPDIYQAFAYLEVLQPAAISFIFVPEGVDERVDPRSKALPKQRRVTRVAVPYIRFFDETLWIEIADMLVRKTLDS